MKAKPTPGAGGGSAREDARSPPRSISSRVASAASSQSFLWLAGTLLATVFITAILLQLWNANFSLPFDYGGDATYTLAYIKDVIQHFWYDTNPQLAAPIGAELYDYPAFAGDNLQFVLMKALSLGSGNAPTVMNAFYVLTYPLDALAAYLVFVRLRLTRPTAAACALLFAFIPFHFLRAEFHLTFSSYYGVPIDAYLILFTFGGRPLFARRARPGRWWAAWLSRRTLATVALCVIAGTASDYYAFFGILIIAIGTPLAALRARSSAILATGAAVIAVIGAMLVVDYSPTLIYEAVHGADAQVVQRSPVESELYSLRLIQLLLPNSLDRIHGLGSEDTYYNLNSVIGSNESTTDSLGVVGAVGFLWLLAVAGLGLLGVPEGPLTSRLVRDTALAALLAFLIGTTGGIGALFSFLIYPDIRAYNRISPFISFFALIGIGVLLDGLGRFAKGRHWPATIAPALTVGVVAFGIFEEAPLTSTPPYAQTAAAYQSDDAFVHQIQSEVGRTASIFELPYERLPAVNLGEGAQYANIVGYVHSSTLKWSYGSLPGRPDDWQSSLVTEPLSLVLPSIVAAGFTGLQIDRPALASPQLAPLLKALASLPDNRELTSLDGRYSFFDLDAYAKALRTRLGPTLTQLGAATVYPLTLNYGAGFFAPDVPGPNNPRWAGSTAVFKIDNPSSRPQIATYSVVLKTGHDNPYAVEIAWPGGAESALTVTAKGTPVSRRIAFPPGVSTVRLSTNAPPAQDAPGDTRVVNVNVSNVSLVAAVAAPFLGPRAGPFAALSVLGTNGLLS
jgi:phosphoglycerol transferase